MKHAIGCPGHSPPRDAAAFVLGMGSTTWEEHLPLIEQIAGRFALS
jgi:hypothetical protein